MDKPEMRRIDPPEKSRTYYFPSGKLTIENVVAVCVRPSGTHRVETADGRKWIIPPTWIGIELDVTDWTF